MKTLSSDFQSTIITNSLITRRRMLETPSRGPKYKVLRRICEYLIKLRSVLSP